MRELAPGRIADVFGEPVFLIMFFGMRVSMQMIGCLRTSMVDSLSNVSRRWRATFCSSLATLMRCFSRLLPPFGFRDSFRFSRRSRFSLCLRYRWLGCFTPSDVMQ